MKLLEEEKEKNELDIIKEKDILNEEIKKLKIEYNEIQKQNEQYINEIKEKNEIINKIKEDFNLYKKESENNINQLNQIIKQENENNQKYDTMNKELKNELELLKGKLDDKEKQNKELIENFKDEAIEAKMKLADSNFENDKKYMKLKRQVEKLISTLESLGVKVKEIK